MVLAVAAGVRLAHWGAVSEADFVAHPILDSAEYARWAHEIAAGDWIGSAPFFQAPLYPYLLAVVFAAGGGLDAVYLLQIALAVAGLWAVARAGDRLLGPPHGLVAAALGALYLPAVFHDVLLLKESLATTLVAFLLWALAAARAPERSGRSRAWLVAGALVGALALLRENMLLVALFLLPLAWEPRDRRATSRRLGAFAAGALLMLLPVAARNAALGGGFLPTTFQGGVNFWIGNNPEADGTYRPLVPGKQIPAYERSESQRLAEQALGRPLTGAQASRYWLGRALGWMASHPLAAARLELRKLALYLSPYEWPDAVDYYWFRTISPALALPGIEWGALWMLALAGVVLAWPLRATLAPVLLFETGWLVSTVAFFLFARYRLPAAPGLWILAAVPLVAAARAWEAGERRRAAVAMLALAAIWLLPRALDSTPRMDLVEFNRGRLAQERGDAAAAVRSYRAAIAFDAKAFLPRLDLGTLAARAGDYDTAERWFREAAELQPDSDDAHANLGATKLAQGELDEAAMELDRALAINRRNLVALQNRVVLALQRGDVEAARNELERLLRIEPDNARALELARRIR